MMFYDIFNLRGDFMFENDNTCFENTFNYSLFKDLNMYYCGKRIKSVNHSYGPEVRSHFLVVLVKEGTATVHSYNGAKLVPGDILVMFPGENVHYTVDEGELWSISWIGIYGSRVCEIFGNFGITSQKPVFKANDFMKTKKVMSDIYDLSFSDKEVDKIEIISLLYSFFSVAIPSEDKKTNRNYVAEAKHIINYNFDKNISIERIAESLFVNPNHLSRVFKKETGITVKDYITSMRLNRACELLEEENVPVNVVANSVGIGDQLYFSRFFKKCMGVTPTQYRNNLKKTIDKKRDG